jgi:hypothetical protein
VNKIDQRYSSIKNRLEALPREALQKFLDYPGYICYDTYNFDSAEGAYCPIAIMLGVPDHIKENGLRPTQDLALSLIRELSAQHPGFVFGTVKGETGRFYTQEREQDLKKLCREILSVS